MARPKPAAAAVAETSTCWHSNKIAQSYLGSGHFKLSTGYHGPIRSTISNCIRIRSAILPQCTEQTERQTDTETKRWLEEMLDDYRPLSLSWCGVTLILIRSIWKMLGPFTTASRLTPTHQVSLPVLSRAACASMSTTTTTTTTRDRGDRYGPMEWAQ